MSNSVFRVLIPCAGSGSRFNYSIPKQYVEINGKSILEYTLNVFLSIPLIEQIIIVANPYDSYIDSYVNLSAKIIIHKVGDTTRAGSVLNGLKQLNCKPDDWILVHDAARCCITPENVNELILQLQNDNVGGILAIAATDTLKLGLDNVIKETIDRSKVYLAQTPQMFRYGVLYKALDATDLDQITDEASAVERLGLPVHLVKGDVTNIKVTYPFDLHIARLLFSMRDKALVNNSGLYNGTV